MKRLIVAAVLGMAVVGCAGKGGSEPVKASAAAPTKANYFEMTKDGRTYVFGSVQAMQKFATTGDAGKTVDEYYKGRVVTFEASEAVRLKGEYEKQHK
jgi:hypothetical protein